MTTLYLTHPACLKHDMGHGHPERPDRLRAIEHALSNEAFNALDRAQAPKATLDVIARAHPTAYIDQIRDAAPTSGVAFLDPDTSMSVGSWEAALRAAGAAIMAVDAVMTGKADNAFCAVRPPGHHAEDTRAMGFCLFNNVAIGAMHARAEHGAERVAVIDFDVHHGNGTQQMFWSNKDLFYASTHQMPLYPGTGAANETGVGNIFNAPLAAGDGSLEFRQAFNTIILPALESFHPDLIMISAGFDAHRNDLLANLNLVEEDFMWATQRLAQSADLHCDGKLVSMLEGGYDLRALSDSVTVHVAALIEAGQ